jgi:hypothetical protein
MGDITPESWREAGFGDAWRVTPKTSLFDYAPGASTRDFSFRHFPEAKIPPVKPENRALAARACAKVNDEVARRSCLFDVSMTGDSTFLEGALADRELQLGATQTTLAADKASSKFGEVATFSAFVVKQKAGLARPTGAIQFFVDDEDVSGPIMLGPEGQARWTGALTTGGQHRVQARFSPDVSGALPSSSSALLHTVEGGPDGRQGGL